MDIDKRESVDLDRISRYGMPDGAHVIRRVLESRRLEVVGTIKRDGDWLTCTVRDREGMLSDRWVRKAATGWEVRRARP